LSWSAVLLLARVMTERRSEGGKAPGSAGARGVLEAGEAFGDEAFAPLADGVAVAVEFGSDVLIRRGVRLGGEQDDAATEDECLRGGTGADEVVFHYTPIHGSWLNQVELFFGVVARRFLRRGVYLR